MELVSLCFWALAHIASLFLILWVAYTVGDIWLCRLSFRFGLERAVITVVVGLGLCALLLLALGVVGLLYRPLLLSLTAATALIGIWRFFKGPGISSVRLGLRRLGAAGPWKVGGFCLLIAYWLLLLFPALYPPIQWDATAYHLVHARDLLASHQIRPNFGITWPVLPLLNHLLFSWGMAIWDDILAQLVEHAFLMLTALGLYSWGRRIGQQLGGLIAATIWLSHPLVLWLGSAAYVDVCLATFAFFGIYSLRLFWEGGEPGFWLLGLAFFGMEAGTKISGVAILPIAGCFALWMISKRRLSIRQASFGLGTAACFTLPWYFVIGYFTGNPVWPLFAQYGTGVWANPNVVEAIVRWESVGVAKTVINYLLAPVLLIQNPGSFLPDNNFALAPILILFPVCWLVMFADRSVRWWTLWTSAILMSWFLSSQQMRLLLPAIPIAGLAIVESLHWIATKLRAPAGMRRAVYITLVALFSLSGALTTIDQLRIRGTPPISQNTREEWLSKYSAGYKGVAFINQRARSDQKVYLINASWLAYHLRPQTLAIEGPIQREFWPSLKWPDRDWTAHLRSVGVNWILVNHLESPEWMNLRRKGAFTNPFEPDYERVYGDSRTWVFRIVTTPESGPVAEKRRRGEVPCFTEGSPSPAEPTSSTIARKLEGFLDIANCDQIAGWVWDSQRPDEAVTVEIYYDDSFLSSVVAREYRPDLEKAGRGNGRHGFSFSLPLCLQDGRPHQIRATVAATDLVLGNSPKNVVCAN